MAVRRLLSSNLLHFAPMAKSDQRSTVTAFRLACELIARESTNVFPGFDRFPVGQCWTASWLLAQYLIQRDVAAERIHIISNAFRGTDSHTWLQIDGTHIDITADQFDDCHDSVLICSSPCWHTGWSRGDREPYASPEPDDVHWHDLYRVVTNAVEHLQ